MVSRRTVSACSMRRSDHPRRPSARICCCVVSSKTLLMPVTELAFCPDVNVSIATGNGRFSAVDQWPVLGVHRGCLTVLEIAERLALNADTVRRLFMNEPGLIVITEAKKGRREYRTLRVPERIFQRVLMRFTRGI